MYTLHKSFTFEAAHHLPALGGNHKCMTVHGHNYRVQIEIQAPELAEPEGWIMDFGELSELWQHTVHHLLDHSLINNQVWQPTAENLARWIFEQLISHISEPARLVRVTVWENPECGASYQA